MGSFRDFQKNLEKQKNDQMIIQQLEAQIKTLEQRRDEYAEKAKKEYKRGNKAQYSAMVTLLKYTIYNISNVESMLANYTIAKEMSDIQNISKAFSKSLRSVLKDVEKTASAVKAAKTQKLFDKALQKSTKTSEDLRTVLSSNQVEFTKAIDSAADVTNDDLIAAFGLHGEQEDSAMDDLLASLESEFVQPKAEEVKPVMVGGPTRVVEDTPITPKQEKKEEEKVEPKETPVAPPANKNIFDYNGKPYTYPSLSLLNVPSGQEEVHRANEVDMQEKSVLLRNKLGSFGVQVEIENIVVGASVSRIEMSLISNTPLSTIGKLENDLAMSLGRKLRLLLPIEGKALIGAEVENAKHEILTIHKMVENREEDEKIKIGIGYDVEGNTIEASLDSLPHLLVGGTTGAGKSVFLSSVINTLLFRYSPEKVRLVLIDFKRVEMNIYTGIPHLVTGRAINEITDAIVMLEDLVSEMERRYDLFEKSRTRNLEEYNKKTGANLGTILVVIDEYADMTSAPEYKIAAVHIQRIAQKARAAGIHMIIATQRPSVKVIDGVIKANLPSRVAFRVASHVDSMNILDLSGAEDLIGKGDMLFQSGGKTIRCQAPYISTGEIGAICDAIAE